MKVLVTGGTGYVGSRLVPELKKEFEVYVLSRRKSGKGFIRGDIRKYEEVRKAVKSFDAVVHLAVESRHGARWYHHLSTTVYGTRNVLKASVEEGVERVVYMSSIAVESRVKSNYVIAKKMAESIAVKYWKFLTVPVIRASSIYDERRVRIFSKVPVFFDLETKVRFTNLYTLIEVVRAALEKGESRIYQVGDRDVVKLVDFLKACRSPDKLLLLPGALFHVARALSYAGKIASFFGIYTNFVPERLDFLKEDKVFENSFEELGVKPRDTFEEVERMKESYSL